ncbi:ParB/RepB/Spo0J family partition protein [Sphaerochaeta halotolerans]|uniref:ParB/RepB/Spo0J family partition protein n=1 Tax=Sphaerochaeta halotolerans TaxID=2293840 RepID=A0A372MKU9_9SPIR|nr:ParB/RepB/Spo0J family partition protein [Sphaerochaeta halotolerans]MBG0766337.1 ParB/RepB/Spo0J family partition protein [Spirochaetaceae bacterium]MDK2859080.1 ParB family transcriptional regulator, chromosome partitioning protein [Sphaerochaeta sp.]MXI87227.1 ParB/RepB/Spo0J family partition protein [Sphaerochaeta halotolerans]RFU96063.1 ParB/RepB/Spo0J family partition protein [Sphaerochaeta halotolerans]
MSQETNKKHGLGKGIGSLMQDYSFDSVLDSALGLASSNPDVEKGQRVLEVPVEQIRANPNQPRKDFNQEALEELSLSIKREGVLQPILVEEIAPGLYSIVAGERRFRAAKIAGLERIPVLVKDFTQMQRLEVSLIENIQRENLNPIEEAKAYAYLIQEAGITQEELAKRLGKNRSTISNSIRLLQLSSSMQQDLLNGKFTAGQARAILSVVNPADREILYRTVLEKDLSVRATEQLASQFNMGKRAAYQSKKKRAKKSLAKAPEIIAIEDKFLHAVGSQVEIKGSLEKGKIEIPFTSSEELERLYQLLMPNQGLFEL